MIDPPPGLIRVPLPKGCVLLLTAQEFAAGIHRAKWWKRRAAMAGRTAPVSTPSHAPDTPQEA